MASKQAGKRKTGRGGVAVVVTYARRMEEYAERYETALRTVKRWAAVGRESGDSCPLDRPEEMPTWWTRHMKHRVPDALFRAAGKSTPATLLTVDAPATSPPATPPGDDVEVPEGRGVEAELARLERLSAQLSVMAAQPGQTKAYLDSIARMTSLQKQVREEAEKARRLLPSDMVEQAIHDFHGPIEREVRLAGKSMCESLGVRWSDALEARWQKECDSIFSRFQTDLFGRA